jgi:hypothetical protein
MEAQMDNGVNNDDRLLQLIAKAKQRREEQRQRELREFQQQLEDDLTTDLCALLGLSCKLEKAGEQPVAVFTLGGWTWTIGRPTGSVKSKWVAHLTSRDWNREPIGFNTEDDLLLLIDALPN